jgi:hypothetical protein
MSTFWILGIDLCGGCRHLLQELSVMASLRTPGLAHRLDFSWEPVWDTAYESVGLCLRIHLGTPLPSPPPEHPMEDSLALTQRV